MTPLSHCKKTCNAGGHAEQQRILKNSSAEHRQRYDFFVSKSRGMGRRASMPGKADRLGPHRGHGFITTISILQAIGAVTV
jgi:hypothetical protein